MKTLNQILVAAVAVVGVASVAHADFSIESITPTGSTVGINSLTGDGSSGNPYVAGSTYPNAINGQTTFAVTISGSGVGAFDFAYNDVFQAPTHTSALSPSLFQVNNITSTGGNALTGSFSPRVWNSASGALTTAGTYDFVIDWTINGVFNGYPNYNSVFDVSTYGITLTDGGLPSVGSVDAYISAVPEPSQAIAGITLLGCGGLVFLGRRFVAKKA